MAKGMGSRKALMTRMLGAALAVWGPNNNQGGFTSLTENARKHVRRNSNIIPGRLRFAPGGPKYDCITTVNSRNIKRKRWNSKNK